MPKLDESERALQFRVELPELDQPRVSIIICNFNHGRYVAQAVQSALKQHPTCEVIVVDDGSTDASLVEVRPFLDCIQVVEIPHQGQRAAYLAGFRCCVGEVVVFLDADDFLFAGAIQRVLTEMKTGIGRVHFRLALVDENSRQLDVAIPHELAAGWLAPHLLSGILAPSAPGSGNAYRREVLELLFPLPTSSEDLHGADFFLVYGSMFLGNVAAVDAPPLGAYRVQTSPQPQNVAPFFFGNAAKRKDREQVLDRRIAQWKPWIAERLQAQLHFPGRIIDFSTMKSVFASRVLDQGSVRGRLDGVRYCPLLLRSIWLHPEFSRYTKLGLTVWASLVLVLPRKVARPIARYVIDPASRASLGRAADT